MAYPTYGQHLLRGYGERPEPLGRRTPMESGPAKQVRRAVRRMVRRPVAYRYSATEYASWLTWFDTEGAVGWFDWEDPRDGATKQARIVDFVYDADMVRDIPGEALPWEVSFTLEVYE